MVILCPTGPGGGSSLTTLGSHRSIPALGAPCAAALLPLRLRCRGRGRRCGRAAALGAGAAAAAQRVPMMRALKGGVKDGECGGNLKFDGKREKNTEIIYMNIDVYYICIYLYVYKHNIT